MNDFNIFTIKIKTATEVENIIGQFDLLLFEYRVINCGIQFKGNSKDFCKKYRNFKFEKGMRKEGCFLYKSILSLERGMEEITLLACLVYNFSSDFRLIKLTIPGISHLIFPGESILDLLQDIMNYTFLTEEIQTRKEKYFMKITRENFDIFVEAIEKLLSFFGEIDLKYQPF